MRVLFVQMMHFDAMKVQNENEQRNGKKSNQNTENKLLLTGQPALASYAFNSLSLSLPASRCSVCI